MTQWERSWIRSIQSLLLSGVPDISSRTGRNLSGPALHLRGCFLCDLSIIRGHCGEQMKHVCVCVFYPNYCSVLFSHANLMRVKCVWLPAWAGLKSSGASKLKDQQLWEIVLLWKKVLYVHCSLMFDSLNLTSASDETLYTFEIVVIRARGDTHTQGVSRSLLMYVWLPFTVYTENSRKKLD